MSDKNLFEFVKGILKTDAAPPARTAPPPKAPPRQAPPPAPMPRPQPRDDENPATIVRVGRSNDGRDLLMTQGFGIFLVDREAPTICYFDKGVVQPVPTLELKALVDALMAKRAVGPHALHYVDLLNVATHELESRQGRRPGGLGLGSLAPLPPPKRPLPPGPAVPDAENPATIVRVGRSHHGADLVMTLGLGTFVVDRERVTLRYFDRGREWDVPESELATLIEALMAKEEMAEHRYAYIDLLNVATFVQQQKRPRRR